MVDFHDVYHAILSRLCFTKFMAVSNYTYLKLKMPSPNGVITIEASFEQVYYCKQDHVTQVATLTAPCILDGLGHDVERAPVEGVAKAAAVLNQSSIDKMAKTPSGSGGSAGSSI